MTGADPILGSYWTLAGDADPTGERRQWSRWSFEDRVAGAAAAGFDGIGIWHADLDHVRQDLTLREMRAILDEHGIDYLELEFLNDWFLDEGDERRARSDELRDTLLEAAEALDATHVKVGNLARREASIERMAEGFGYLCEAAASYDVTVALEFIPFLPNVRTVSEAVAVVEGARTDNGGILLDAWHVAQTGTPYDELREIPADQLAAVELNDGRLVDDDELGAATVNRRRLPGEGEFDLQRFVETMRDIGYAGPWGVEVLSEELRELPMDELYERAYESTRECLDGS